MIMLSCLFWTTVYNVVLYLPMPLKPAHLELNKVDALDVKNRMVSFLHGATLLIFSAYTYYFMPGSCGDRNTSYDKNLIYCAVGYFLYDFLAMAYYGLLDKTMTIHHWICIIGMSYPLTYDMSANYIVMGMFVAECSNPAMHVRQILRHYGLRYSRAYESMEISFLLLYIFGRFINGTSLVWLTCRCQENNTIVKFCSVGLLAQSFLFLSQMISMLKKRFSEIAHRKRHGIKARWFEPLNKVELEKLGLNNAKKTNEISL